MVNNPPSRHRPRAFSWLVCGYKAVTRNHGWVQTAYNPCFNPYFRTTQSVLLCCDELKPGDLIEIFRSSCQHWAIYVGDRKVVHLATERDHLAGGPPNTLAVLSNRAYVKKDWLDNVVQKDRFRVNNKHDERHPPLPLAKILWQAEELVGKEMPCAWNSHNCEHFVMELRYGAEMHEQVCAWIYSRPGSTSWQPLSLILSLWMRNGGIEIA
uniref:LRAT domain-containing protein n=1 Tax=Varanus komodoensis TaxID=61221 RepID=A0A8D2J6M8_VARKO